MEANYYPTLKSTIAHFALRMTVLCLLDALFWELSTRYSNNEALMQDSIDKADLWSDKVY